MIKVILIIYLTAVALGTLHTAFRCCKALYEHLK